MEQNNKPEEKKSEGVWRGLGGGSCIYNTPKENLGEILGFTDPIYTSSLDIKKRGFAPSLLTATVS